jgi:hypothetical protein
MARILKGVERTLTSMWSLVEGSALKGSNVPVARVVEKALRKAFLPKAKGGDA